MQFPTPPVGVLFNQQQHPWPKKVALLPSLLCCDLTLLTVSMRIFFCSVAISFFSSSCAPWRKASWLFSMSSMFWGTPKKPSLYIIQLVCWNNYHEISVISILKWKHGQDHLDKVLVEIPDHLKLLALNDSGLLQDLLLLSEQILEKEKHTHKIVTWQLSKTCW